MRKSIAVIMVLLTCGVIAWACGAENAIAPRAQENSASLDSCRGEEGLTPRFKEAIAQGKTEGLRKVMESELLVGGRSDSPPPLNSVLRAVFSTLTEFAAKPPEDNALAGETCAAVAPPIEMAHPLCEMRRAGRLLIHEGKGAEWLTLLDPQISGLLNYIIGKEPSSSVPHYEIANILFGMCQQSATCQLSDTFDLLNALLDFAETKEGADSLRFLSTLVKNPELQPFLTDDEQQYGGESGFVALLKTLLTIIQGMQSPDELDSLPLDQLPASLQPDLQTGVGYIKKMLDVNRQPNVLIPLKKVLYCHQTQDSDLELFRMFYRLALEKNLEAFGLRRLASTLDSLRESDQRGSLLFLGRQIIAGIRKDEVAVDAAAAVCRTFTSTRVAPGENQSNAERVLPVVSELFSQGLVTELICAVDTLIYGCTGGQSPACVSTSAP